MSTTIKSKTAAVAKQVTVEAVDFALRVKQLPDLFSGLSGEYLLNQLPAMQGKAKAHKAGFDEAVCLDQIKAVTRVYRREAAALADDDDRLAPVAIVPHLIRLEALLAGAEAFGVGREALMGKADSLTQKIAISMALVGLLV